MQRTQTSAADVDAPAPGVYFLKAVGLGGRASVHKVVVTQ
jgi:hypothetical protein